MNVRASLEHKRKGGSLRYRPRILSGRISAYTPALPYSSSTYSQLTRESTNAFK